MISIFKEKLKKILLSIITNPMIIILYWICFYELNSICKYGKFHNNIYIFILTSVAILIVVIVISIFSIKNEGNNKKSILASKAWVTLSITIILSITIFYGLKIYKDALKYESKLSWFIEKIINERTVKLNNNNIYKDGIEGIFEDINTKCDLPEKLYLANSFNLKFSPGGTINSLYTLVYGKSKNGKDESFLITYDKSKSEDIYIHLNGSVNTDYSNDKLMQPLFDTVKNISIKDTVSNWNEDLYGILYYGKRNLGYNAEGVVNIDNNGNEISIETTYSEIIGYIVSVFVPDKEKEITPIRYNNISLQSMDNKLDTSSKNEDNYISLNSKEEFYLSKEVGYKLEGVDKVAGSTLYVLNKTTDSGLTWELINNNPFGNVVGNISGITFIDENIGFLVSGNVSETEGILYRTEDAGKSFKIITYATDIEYFDFLGLPYEENGELCMLVGQGSDGDYNGNSSVLYKSKDKGITWEYIEEVKREN